MKFWLWLRHRWQCLALGHERTFYMDAKKSGYACWRCGKELPYPLPGELA